VPSQLMRDSLGRGMGGSIGNGSGHRTTIILALFLTGCYEHAPRRGPLATLADSVALSGGSLTCRQFSAEGLLPHQPRFRSCMRTDDSTVVVDIGRSGRVLSIRQFWPDDSLGKAKAASTIDSMTRQLGPPSFAGADMHGHHVHQWTSDSVCAGLYQRQEGGPFQFIRSTPDALGRGRCP